MSLTLKSIFAGLSPNPDLKISVNKIKNGIFCIFGCRYEILHKRNKSLNEKQGDVVWGAMREWGMVLSSNEFHGFVSRLTESATSGFQNVEWRRPMEVALHGDSGGDGSL